MRTDPGINAQTIRTSLRGKDLRTEITFLPISVPTRHSAQRPDWVARGGESSPYSVLPAKFFGDPLCCTSRFCFTDRAYGH